MKHDQGNGRQQCPVPARYFSNLSALPMMDELSHHFQSHEYQIALTGGATRDCVLGRTPPDFDLISDAPPDRCEELLAGWADNAHRSPNPFGRVTCTKDGTKLEVLTFRTPKDLYPPYDAALLSGDPLYDQLAAADLTIHAGALLLPSHEWVDPFNAVPDLHEGILRTPIDPHAAILGHPACLLRYARFAAELGFTVAPDLLQAMTELAGIIQDNWTWRCVQILSKILVLPNAEVATAILRETTILERLPERWQARLSAHFGTEVDAV